MREVPGTRHSSPLLLALAILVPAEAVAAATYLVLAERSLLAGVSALVASAVIVGVVPVTGGSRGLFASRVLDRVFEASLLAAMAWVARSSSPRLAVVALAALGLSYLASYERARGEGLGYRGVESTVYTGAREALVVLALLTGRPEPFVWALAAVAALAAGVRAANVVRQERRRQLAGWGLR